VALCLCPLIAKADRYLAGWKATLLSTARRIVLINSVLDGLPTYAMGALMLLPGIKKALDARRRAFLWTAADKVNGAQCLVAWEKVCQPKEEGGQRIKRLDTQNVCLLLKLIHHLHHSEGSAWAIRVQTQTHLDSLQGNLTGTHWDTLRDVLPAYRKITRVDIGDGRNTSFWDDTWLGDCPWQNDTQLYTATGQHMGPQSGKLWLARCHHKPSAD
jgi:hypothetical protein